jgi:predicted Zn-dependent protease
VKLYLGIAMMIKKILPVVLCFQFVFVSFAQETSEDKAGKQTYESVKKSYGIYINEPALAEVESIGRALEKHLSFTKPIKYFLVDTPEPNAFATLGGYVYVTRGLLSIINTRDELAGIMAHEISHVTQNHPKKTTEAHIIPAVLQIPGNLANVITSSSVGNLVNVPIEVIFSIPLASYSRHNEKEADLIGVDLATKAGFDPYGLVRALERLEVYVNFLIKEPMHKSIFIDHPMTVDRVAYLTEHLKKLGYERTPDKSGTNMKSLDGLLYGLNPKYGIFRKDLYVNPLFNFQMMIPEKWEADITLNTVSSVSKDKKSMLIFQYDTSSKSISEMMHKVKSNITTMKIKSLDSNAINGLNAYRLVLLATQGGLTYDMIWIQLPGKNTYLRISAVYPTGADNKEVHDYVNSFKEIQQVDISKMYYRTIVLKNVKEGEPMELYVPDYTTDTTGVELIAIFNNADADKPIDSSSAYMKVIRKIPLSLYKED